MVGRELSTVYLLVKGRGRSCWRKSTRLTIVEAVALELATVSWQVHGVMLFGTFERDGMHIKSFAEDVRMNVHGIDALCKYRMKR